MYKFLVKVFTQTGAKHGGLTGIGFIGMLALVLCVAVLFTLVAPIIMDSASRMNLTEAMGVIGDYGYVAYAAPSGDWTTTGDLITQDVRPQSDSTYYIGTNAARYLGGYFDNLYASNSTITVGNITTLNAPTGRGATWVIAANDAPTIWKTQANATCDGVADNVEWQAAVTAGYTSLVASPGTFVLADTITISNDNTTLKGQGQRSTIFNVPLGVDKDAIALTASNVLLQDFELDSASAVTGSGITIAQDEVRIKISNVLVYNFPENGIELNGANLHNVEYISILDSVVWGCAGNGILITYSAGNNIDGCNLSTNGNDGLSATYLAESSIVNNDIEGNERYGIYLAEVWGDNRFTGNVVMYSHQHGMYVDNSQYNTISGNVFRDNSQDGANTYDGIYLFDQANYNSITGNTFRNDRYGVSINSYSKYNTIESNELTGATAGLGIAVADGIYLDQNVIKGNRGYIAVGEIRGISRAILPGNQNQVTSIQNVFGGDVLILEAYVSITTAASATNPTYDMGTDDDGAGAPSVANNLFEAIPDTVAYYQSNSNGLGGAASGVQTAPILWQAVGNDYVNFIITDAAGADTAGTIYLKVMGK